MCLELFYFKEQNEKEDVMKVKKILPKLVISIMALLICIAWLMIKNDSYIEFVVMEDGIVLEEDARLEINYGVDEDIPNITALYKETIFNKKGTVLADVEVIGEYRKDVLGEYPVILRAEYNDFVQELDVVISVRDTMSPVITLEGETSMTLMAGDAYVEPGFRAIDNYDGDITDQVVVQGTVRANGRSYLTYEITDSNGNTSKEERCVTVEIGEEQKIIYLTFDDGPCVYTERLLDVLDNYNAKVTFFVIGGNDRYYDMIGEAYDRGHTIAVHSFTHDYKEIYQSTDAFYNDLEKIEQLVVSQTGVTPTILRFPGGTGNKVHGSKEGIMSELVETLPDHGYIHCDWNVSSGDGAPGRDEETVFNNVISGIQRLGRKESAVVLMHDIRSDSVDAVDDIIEWGLENGYVFLPLIDESPMIQHAPAK